MNAVTTLEGHPQILLEEALNAEKLTASQWAKIIGISDRQFRDRVKTHSAMELVNGGLARVYTLATLPQDYQQRAKELLDRQRASTFSSLLHIREVETRWVPDRAFETYPSLTKERALKKMQVARVYFSALDADKSKGEANTIARAEWLKVFGEDCSFKTIQRLEGRVEGCGGIDFAPREAYCDGKSTPHHRARRHVKLAIPDELIAEFKALTTKCEHIMGAYRKLEGDWLMGREVPGIGARTGNAPFPYKYTQLRAYAASTPARRRGSHGKARSRRETLPFMHTTTATLRRCELLLLDDTRIDIVATDIYGKPVELKSYWLMDVATRQILAFVVKEGDALKAEDVFAMLARAFRTTGLPVGYPIHIKFERGAVACTAAAQTMLESIWPGRILVHRTGMDGGRNFAGDFLQKASGHWMGKSHIESFMRTLAYRLEHLPGQRGGTYVRQPAQLGLEGKNRKSNLIEFTKGSQIHEAARGEMADRALRLLNTGSVQGERQLKIEALRPVGWIIDAIKEAVAIYNANTDHRMEGFARVEYQDPKTNALGWRMESPNERAAALEMRWPTERIAESDAVTLLRTRAMKVTVRRNGVTFDLAPYKGLNFWKEGSKVCHEVSLLSTQKREYVALFDPDAVRHYIPGADNSPLEIHILGDLSFEDWKAGKQGRYIETLPLNSYADRTDPEQMAKQLGKYKSVEARAEAELLQAMGPIIARDLARTKDNVSKLQGAVVMNPEARREAEPSALFAALNNPQAGEGETARQVDAEPEVEAMPLSSFFSQQP